MSRPSTLREFWAGNRPDRRRRRLHPLAVVSLILGLLAMRPVAAAAALVTGLWARRSIRRSAGRAWGKTLALIGVALGSIGLGAVAISAHQMVTLYCQVTPLARELFLRVEKKQWRETYDLFSPAYQHRLAAVTSEPQEYPPHEMRMKDLFGTAEGWNGLRWAFRFDLRDFRGRDPQASVTYDAFFGAMRRRFRFDFVETTAGWRIDDVEAQ